MKFDTKTVLIIGAIALGAFLIFREGNATQTVSSTNGSANVTTIDGQQVVTMNVKGGYQPQVSTVKAGIPTILRFTTNGTFDCSSSIRIPSLGIDKNLPSTGTTDISVGALSAGTLQGTCSMGMYRFEIDAE